MSEKQTVNYSKTTRNRKQRNIEMHETWERRKLWTEERRRRIEKCKRI